MPRNAPRARQNRANVRPSGPCRVLKEKLPPGAQNRSGNHQKQGEHRRIQHGGFILWYLIFVPHGAWFGSSATNRDKQCTGEPPQNQSCKSRSYSGFEQPILDGGIEQRIVEGIERAMRLNDLPIAVYLATYR